MAHKAPDWGVTFARFSSRHAGVKTEKVHDFEYSMYSQPTTPAVTYVRTALFYVLSGLLAVPFLLFWPGLLLPERFTFGASRLYLRLHGAILKYICGITYQVEGQDNLPEGPVLIASQHESTWETFYFQTLLDRPVMYAKSEIFSYPIFGPLTRKLGHIPVYKSSSVDVVRDGFRRGADALKSGRKLLIFPTGTRRISQARKLQAGVGVVYQMSGVAVIPVLVDSGKCWPSGSFLKHPGTIHVTILPAIPAGLDRRSLMHKLDAVLIAPQPDQRSLKSTVLTAE